MEHFRIGTEFHTYKELLAAKSRYEQNTKTLLTTKKSAKFGADDPRCEDLVYSRIQYQCKAGQERKSTSKGNRNVSSGKMNCPVLVTLSVREGKLCVLSSMLQHENHTQDAETFMKYPENLRLKPNEIRYAKELLAKGFNKKTIKAKLKEKRGGVPVSQKFWAQIHRAMRSDNFTSGKSGAIDETFDPSYESLLPEIKVINFTLKYKSTGIMNCIFFFVDKIQVKQEFDTRRDGSDCDMSDDMNDDINDNMNDDINDDTNDGCADPLSDMFQKCTSNDTEDDGKNVKLKKDFDDWFKNLIPGENLSYNEWLWQLEFNFPSLDKLNFIKYGIILGMTIVNKYYFDGSMKIDGNGIKNVGTEFARIRKKSLRPVNNLKDEDDEEEGEDDDDHDNFEDHLGVGEADVQFNDNEEDDVIKESSSTSTSTSKPSIPIVQPKRVEPTQPNNEPKVPINCKMCPEVFPTHSQLYAHMCKNHTGHIGINCPICNKRFQYERSLSQHIGLVHKDGLVRNHTDERGDRPICEICGASFDKITSLKSHVRYVHSIEKFYCKYCNRKLSSKKSLREHIQFQHELTFVTHECEDCHRIFKYKSSYRLHMKKQHGIHFG